MLGLINYARLNQLSFYSSPKNAILFKLNDILVRLMNFILYPYFIYYSHFNPNLKRSFLD